MMRATTLKASPADVEGLLAYYAGLADEQARRDGTCRGPIDYYLVSREHKPLNRNYFNSHIWRPALLAAGVEPSRANGMHALRHFYASVLIDAGESVKAVAEYLGHADPGFTLRVYAHLFPSSEDRARHAVDRTLSAAGVGRVTGPAYDEGATRRPR